MIPVLQTAEPAGPEADRLEGAAHPREVLGLVGHSAQEAEFLASWRSGRLHHAWLITGEEGVGKATLAYRMARFMLAFGIKDPSHFRGNDLTIEAGHPVVHQVAANAHPDLAVIRRTPRQDSKALATEIRVDDVRHGLDVFNKTAAFGGYRICIVDSCDELNASSANALLKTLEEPPAQSLFLLIAHAPGRLLPTIRSRCRTLALRPLSDAEIATALSGFPATMAVDASLREAAALEGQGSLRRAMSMLDEKRLAFASRTRQVLDNFPALDGAAVDWIAEQTAGRAGDASFESFCDICEQWMADRMAARDGSVDVGRLATAWSALAEKRRAVDALNLDRRPYVVEAFTTLAASSRLQAD